MLVTHKTLRRSLQTLLASALLLRLVALRVIVEHDFVARHALELLLALCRLHAHLAQLAILTDIGTLLLLLDFLELAL